MTPLSSTFGPTVLSALHKGQLWGLPGRRGERIRSRRGAIWVTQDGDPNDVILNHGEVHVLAADGPVLIQALDRAWVSVEPRQPTRGVAWWRRLRDAIRLQPMPHSAV